MIRINWSGPLTCEDPKAAEDEHARWLANALLEADRASVVRPCPGVERLFALHEQPGKVTRDAAYPQAFRGWQG